MYILSNDASLTREWFGDVTPLRPSMDFADLPDRLPAAYFSESDYRISQHNSNVFWRYALMQSRAQRSQFTLLQDCLRNGTELPDGLLCLTRNGNGLQGFRNRSWETESGNLHLTVHLKPQQKVPRFLSAFLMLAAVSVVQAIHDISGTDNLAGIKWVNDIVVGRAKVGGVLTHSVSQGDIVSSVLLGVGVNLLTAPAVRPDSFVPEVMALSQHLPYQESNLPQHYLERLLVRLQSNYYLVLKGQSEQLLKAYRTYSAVMGRRVRIFSDPLQGKPELLHQGIVTDIGSNLELRLKNEPEPVSKGRLVLV